MPTRRFLMAAILGLLVFGLPLGPSAKVASAQPNAAVDPNKLPAGWRLIDGKRLECPLNHPQLSASFASPEDMPKCPECSQRYNNGKLCPACSVRLGRCATCGVQMANAAVPPASQPGEALFGEAVKGIKFGVAGPKGAVPVGQPVKMTLTLCNALDKPVQVLAIFKHGEVINYEVTAPDGMKLRYRGPVTDWDVSDYDKAVGELAPGKAFEQEVSLFGYDFSKPGKYRVSATYRWSNAAPPPGRKPAVWTRGPIWTGAVSSGTLDVAVGGEAAADPAGGPGPTSQPAGAPNAAAAVKLAAKFLAAAKVNASRLQAFAIPAPADDWWMVEYHVEGGLAVSPGPAVYVNKKTGEVTRQAPKGMPPRM